MFTKGLNRVFKERLAEQHYFDQWQREKSRELWKRDVEYSLGIDLQLGKWWGEKGGEVAVNLWCGHRWTVPSKRLSNNDDIDYFSSRLGPIQNQDHWWKIATETDIEALSVELASLLSSRATPWFDKVSTKTGFLDWCSSVYPESFCFPYILEVHGASALKESVCHWLTSAPRGIEQHLDWLLEFEIVSPEIASRLRKASIQAAETYRASLPELIKKIEQNTASNGN